MKGTCRHASMSPWRGARKGPRTRERACMPSLKINVNKIQYLGTVTAATLKTAASLRNSATLTKITADPIAVRPMF